MFTMLSSINALELQSLFLKATDPGHLARVPYSPSQEFLHYSPKSRTTAKERRKPELSLEVKTISDYLRNRSPMYRDLIEIQDKIGRSRLNTKGIGSKTNLDCKGGEKRKADEHFAKQQQQTSDNNGGQPKDVLLSKSR